MDRQRPHQWKMYLKYLVYEFNGGVVVESFPQPITSNYDEPKTTMTILYRTSSLRFFFHGTENPQNSGHFPTSWSITYNKSIQKSCVKNLRIDISETGDNDNFKAHNGSTPTANKINVSLSAASPFVLSSKLLFKFQSLQWHSVPLTFWIANAL